jgi:hypothetical protein
MLGECTEFVCCAAVLACLDHQEPAVELDNPLPQRGRFGNCRFDLNIHRIPIEEPRDPRGEIVRRAGLKSAATVKLRLWKPASCAAMARVCADCGPRPRSKVNTDPPPSHSRRVSRKGRAISGTTRHQREARRK